MSRHSITPEMHYDDWAAAYDGDVRGWDYTAPDKVVGRVADFLQRHDAPPRVLDIGIGTGLASQKIQAIRPDAKISGVDISSEMLRLCARKLVTDDLHRVDVDREKLPHADKSFDLVIAAGVLETVRNIGNVIQEAGRVLRPGGKLIFTYLPSVKNPVGEMVTKSWRPGRTEEGRFVMGDLDMYRHSERKIRIYSSAVGVTPLHLEEFVGYRTYVFLAVKYHLFMGQKKYLHRE